MTIEEIRSRYSCEWVLIAATESDDEWNVIRGEVLAHSPERAVASADFGFIAAISFSTGTFAKTGFSPHTLPSTTFVDGLLGMDFLTRCQAVISVGQAQIRISQSI